MQPCGNTHDSITAHFDSRQSESKENHAQCSKFLLFRADYKYHNNCDSCNNNSCTQIIDGYGNSHDTCRNQYLYNRFEIFDLFWHFTQQQCHRKYDRNFGYLRRLPSWIGPIFNQRADPLELFPIANTARHIRSDKIYANPVIFFIHFCGK